MERFCEFARIVMRFDDGNEVELRWEKEAMKPNLYPSLKTKQTLTPRKAGLPFHKLFPSLPWSLLLSSPLLSSRLQLSASIVVEHGNDSNAVGSIDATCKGMTYLASA